MKINIDGKICNPTEMINILNTGKLIRLIADSYSIILYSERTFPFCYPHFGNISAIDNYGRTSFHREWSTGSGMVSMIRRFIQRADINSTEDIIGEEMELVDVISHIDFDYVLRSVEENFIEYLESYESDFDWENATDEENERETMRMNQEIKDEYSKPFCRYKDQIGKEVLNAFDKIFG